VGGVTLAEVLRPGGPGGVEAQGAKLYRIGAAATVEVVEGGHQAIAFGPIHHWGQMIISISPSHSHTQGIWVARNSACLRPGQECELRKCHGLLDCCQAESRNHERSPGHSPSI